MKWMRPSGQAIKTNEEQATVEHCKSMGWELMKEKKKPATSQDSPPAAKSKESESAASGATTMPGDRS
mgnify:FL=1|jgi:hypothetical protein